MARGTLNNPFNKKDDTPMQRVSGSQIGSAAGMALGSIIPGVGTAIGGAVGGVLGGLFDNGGQNQVATGPSAAEVDMQRRMKEYEQLQFQATNPYAGMQVNLQAAEFQREQQAQQEADILQSLRAGGGGAGSAALATSLMRSSVAKQQQIAADIGKQEQVIQMAQAQAETQIQKEQRAFNQSKLETLLGMSMAQVTGEEQARLAAEQSRMNRSSQLLGAGLSALGTLGSSFIESGGLQPKTTPDTSTGGINADRVYKPATTTTDYNFYERG
jgi:hypothetical protein